MAMQRRRVVHAAPSKEPKNIWSIIAIVAATATTAVATLPYWGVLAGLTATILSYIGIHHARSLQGKGKVLSVVAMILSLSLVMAAVGSGIDKTSENTVTFSQNVKPSSKPSGAKDANAGVRGAGYSFAKDVIPNYLHAPSTAEFHWETVRYRVMEPLVDEKGATYDRWTVHGAVDAQNAFGAVLRTPWSVIIYKADDKFHAARVSLDGKAVAEEDEYARLVSYQSKARYRNQWTLDQRPSWVDTYPEDETTRAWLIAREAEMQELLINSDVSGVFAFSASPNRFVADIELWYVNQSRSRQRIMAETFSEYLVKKGYGPQVEFWATGLRKAAKHNAILTKPIAVYTPDHGYVFEQDIR